MLPSEEIKQRINIVDLIGEYIPLKKAGVNFRAVCPFHEEKTPSFMVSPAKQIWHCFGCGNGGDIFEFIKQMEGVDFPEALRILASRAGIELKRPTQEYKAEQDQKQTLYEINEWAAKFYAAILENSSVAESARQYLARRGFKPETVKKWRLGFTPEDFHTFENFIIKKGFQKKEAAAAGLLVEKENGEYFDRFRSRIMFPLFDVHGRVVGFTGRILKDEEGAAKYVNSPETLVYSKSHLIYGLHLAKNEIRRQGFAVVVEGNVDVVTCHEFDFINVVGSSGTAFTSSQLELLRRFTQNLSFAFDVDAAGLAATRRAVELALTLGFNVKIISLPKTLAKDPDELLRKDPGAWQAQVAEAKNFLDYYFAEIFATINPSSSEGKKQAVSTLLPLLSMLPDPIDRSHYVQKLASHLGLPERIILELLNKQAQRPQALGQEAKKTAISRSRPEILQRRALGLLLKFAKELREEWQAFRPADFTVPALQELFTQIYPRAVAGTFEAERFPQGEIPLLIFAVENELSVVADWNLENIKKDFFGALKEDALKRQMQEVSRAIRAAEAQGQTDEARTLSLEFNNLSKEFIKYNGPR